MCIYHFVEETAIVIFLVAGVVGKVDNFLGFVEKANILHLTEVALQILYVAKGLLSFYDF